MADDRDTTMEQADLPLDGEQVPARRRRRKLSAEGRERISAGARRHLAALTPEQRAERRRKGGETKTRHYNAELITIGRAGVELLYKQRVARAKKLADPKARDAELEAARMSRLRAMRRLDVLLSEQPQNEGTDMTNRHPSLGYEVKNILADTGVPRTVARFACHSCPEHIDFTISGSHNPEQLVKRARTVGWEADVQTASKTVCPACQEAKILARKGEKPMKTNGNGVHPPAPSMPAAAPAPAAPKPTLSVAQQGAAEIAGMLRDPTPAERAKMAEALVAYFDGETGRYSDGMSDQKLAEQLNLPRSMISKFRDGFLGPLQADPEIDSFETKLAELRDDEWERHRNVLARLDGLDAELKETKRRLGLRP